MVTSPDNQSNDHSAFHRRAPDRYFDGSARYEEKQTGLVVVNVHAGDCFVTSNASEVAATVLGSCIAACIRDPVAGIGGMNHFLLPQMQHGGDESARFGAFAMEQLINEIMKRGGVRSRLEAKVFGGGNVIKSSAKIGDKNAVFALDYLAREQITVVSHDVGGSWPRKVRFMPVSGKAMLRRLQRQDDFQNVALEEQRYRQASLEQASHAGSVDLF